MTKKIDECMGRKKYGNVALLVHPMYSIITDIYKKSSGLEKNTFKEMEPEFIKRLNAYKESITTFKNTNTLFLIIEPTKELEQFKLKDFYNYMMDNFYDFAQEKLGDSLKVIKDKYYSEALRQLKPSLKKKINLFSFGEHVKVSVKDYNKFTIEKLKEYNVKVVSKGIQTAFSFDIEHKLKIAKNVNKKKTIRKLPR